MSDSTKVSVLLLLCCISIFALNARKSKGKSKQITVERDYQPLIPGAELEDRFDVVVAPSDRFKFNAAHFIAFKGFRERLHGHNYSVSIRLTGRGKIGHDGYLLDFGDVKTVVGKLCKDLNERFLVPMRSDAMKIVLSDTTCHIVCEDGTEFLIPRDDIAELPVVHTSAEELARYLWGMIIDAFSEERLRDRFIRGVEVSVAEMPHQHATFSRMLGDQQNLWSRSTPLEGCTKNISTSH